MSEKNYKNLAHHESFFVREETPPKVCVECAICKNGIKFCGIPVFPICENCRKILGEMVASHKSNWGK